MRDEPGLNSARALLLVGREITTVSFVRKWVELVLEDDVQVAVSTKATWGKGRPRLAISD